MDSISDPSVTSETVPGVPPKIAAIIELLHTQDNRITAHPLFAVRQKRIVYGLHEDYATEHRWVDGDGECCEEDAKRYEAMDETGEEIPDGVRRLGLIEKWEFVTGCMTEQGCKDFIACNGHNLNEPQIYAYSGYRNAEFIALREWLMSLRPAAPSTGAPTPESDALRDVRAERQRQDEKWGGAQHDDHHTVAEWAQLIEDYAGWARTMAGMNSPDKARRRLIQISALALAAAESLDRAAIAVESGRA